MAAAQAGGAPPSGGAAAVSPEEAEMNLVSVGTPAMWIGFTALVVALLALDLGVLHRKAHAVGVREALVWSAVWIGLALAFNAGIYHWFGPERALEFLTGYLIEKALSV